MTKRIVITNEKGGTGKSTVACLLVEYLNHQQQSVRLIDTDPIQTSQTWANNCQSERRQVSRESADYQIIDTAGTSGSALGWLRQADVIVVPFQSHYADLKVTIDWFVSLNKEWQKKAVFIPNRWQNTKEQREGLKQLEQIIAEEKTGRILNSISNRPAVFAKFLNGNKDNFFTNKDIPSELLELMAQITHALN
jgi:cellulose biosynthesis protein BcsQ